MHMYIQYTYVCQHFDVTEALVLLPNSTLEDHVYSNVIMIKLASYIIKLLVTDSLTH